MTVEQSLHSSCVALQIITDGQDLLVFGGLLGLGIISGVAVFFLKKRGKSLEQQQNRDRLLSEAVSGKEKELVPVAKSYLQSLPEEALMADFPVVEAIIKIFLKGSPQDATALIAKAQKKYPQQTQLNDYEIEAIVARRATDTASLEKVWAGFQRKPDRKDWLNRYSSMAMLASSPSITGLKAVGEHFRQSGDLKALAFLTDTYEKKKIFNEVSLAYFREIHTADSKNPRWQYAIARCLQNFGQFEEAAYILNLCLENNPSYQPALELRSFLNGDQTAAPIEEPAPEPTPEPHPEEPPPPPPPAESEEIKLPDRYVDIIELGRGGMGIVFKAFDDVLKRWVAIKVLQENPGPNQVEMKERFLTESRIMAGLDHPVIPKVFDVSVKPPCYIALEFLEGVDMRGYLSANTNISLKELVKFGIDLADGFHHACERSVLHRDIKPENLMVEKTGRVRILDFGLARQENMQSTLTQAGFVVGTPWYMAPERLKGEPATVSSEIFAFGVTLYEILTGKRPFDGDDFSVIFFQEPKPLRQVRPECPQALEVLILDCLNKNPANRPRTFAEIREDLKTLEQKIL